MPKQRITTAIKEVLNEQFGFDIYIVMKDGEQLVKRFVLDEGSPNATDGFKEGFEKVLKKQFKANFCLMTVNMLMEMTWQMSKLAFT